MTAASRWALCIAWVLWLAALCVPGAHAQTDPASKWLECGDDFAVTNPRDGAVLDSMPLLSGSFSRTMIAYQRGANIYANFRASDGTFLELPEIFVTEGQLLATSQQFDYGLVFYRNAEGNVRSRKVIYTTRQVSDDFEVMSKRECDSNFGIGSFYATGSGFLFWGSSSVYSNSTLVRGAPNFEENPAFDLLHINLTEPGMIESAAMDSSGTILFVFRGDEKRVSGHLSTSAVLSPLLRNSVTEIGTVPLPLDVQSLTMASNGVYEYLILGVRRKSNGQIAITAMQTFDLGKQWTDLLEIIEVPQSLNSRPPVLAAWTDRWVVVYDAGPSDGYRMLQTIKPFPFLYDWKAAERESAALEIAPSSSRSLSLWTRFTTVLIAATSTAESANQISAVSCALRARSSASSQQPHFGFLLTILILASFI